MYEGEGNSVVSLSSLALGKPKSVSIYHSTRVGIQKITFLFFKY